MAEERDLLAELKAALPDTSIEAVAGAKDPTVLVRPEDLLAVCRHLRDKAGMDYLSMVTSVDRPLYYEVIYYLFSYQYGGGPVVVKVRLPKPAPVPVPEPAPVAETEGQAEASAMAEPTEPSEPAPVFMPEIPSVTSLWRGADWQEREVYDMMGIVFTGHPDLKRILTWDGFQGFPLRKEYVSKIELTTEELLPTLPEPLVASNRLERR